MLQLSPVSSIAKIRSWILITVGVALTIGMAVISGFLGWTIAHNDQHGGAHWTGTPAFTNRVFELFASIFVFGLVAAMGGIFQLKTGRPSKLAFLLLLALIGLMAYLGQSIAASN